MRVHVGHEYEFGNAEVEKNMLYDAMSDLGFLGPPGTRGND